MNGYQDKNIVMEDVRLLPPPFRNFSGIEGQYNRAGDRNFAVALDEHTAELMAKDGWNVKFPKPVGEDEEQTREPFLKVTVSFKGRPPRIVLITSRGRTNLGEHEIEMLDYVNIRTVDMIIRPYEWVVNGKTGISAYLQAIYITIEEDALERKYSELEDAQHPRRIEES